MSRQSGGRAPSQRQLRVGEVIRRTVSELLARGDVHDPDLYDASITVCEAQPSPDMRQAIVYVAPLGGRNETETLAALNRNAGTLSKMVAQRIAMKYSPRLKFEIDRTFDRMDETNRLFSQDGVRRDIAPPEDE